MATSGTVAFRPDVEEIISEAYERCGIDPQTRTGDQAVSARRSLNLLFSEWANRGINYWTVSKNTLTLVKDQATPYTLPEGTIDIIDAVIRRTIGTTVTDFQLSSIGRDEYLNIPTKATKARPTEYFLDRQATPVLYVWPAPENSTDVFVSNRIQRIDDVNKSVEDPDVPSRFIAPMVSGLALHST